jgi:hypothetical protein
MSRQKQGPVAMEYVPGFRIYESFILLVGDHKYIKDLQSTPQRHLLTTKLYSCRYSYSHALSRYNHDYGSGYVQH